MGPGMAWIAAHPGWTAGLGLLAAFLALNVLAFRHARAMTCFTPAGRWMRKPEGLTRLQKAHALLGGLTLGRPTTDESPAAYGLAFETHTVPGRWGDLEAWYLPHPSPAGVVLLFHGYHACKSRLLPEARAFHELGYACFLLDFPGCGDSAGRVTTIGYGEAQDVARAVAYVRDTWPGQPLMLFGHSMGAAAILRAMAYRGVEAEAAVLESPFDRLLTTVKARFRTMGVPPFPAAQLLVFWGGLMHGYNGFAHNPVTYARHVRCPVLILYGHDDRRVAYDDVRAVYNALPGEKAMHVFEGLGHGSYATPRPGEWKAQVGAFLAGRVPACERRCI
jgi:alpha-beta hydrolase superfamily lysophospholipase